MSLLDIVASKADRLPLVDELALQIERGEVTAAIIGLGYVGLPLAQAIAAAGMRVIGFDTDPARIEALVTGRRCIEHIPAEGITDLIDRGLFEPTGNFARLGEADIVVICVPTPLNRHREPDLTCVEGATRDIARSLRRGQLVVLESTTYPGTCDEVVRPILEKGGLVHDRDFFLAFSPEREDPGNPDFHTASIPKVVGGGSPDALRLANLFYGKIVVRTVSVSSLRTAEAVKLTENIFRAVNIALVNELKVVYDEMGVDVWEVIEAAKSKPFGFMPFYPGPGLGGHCIPIDPFYLTWKAREYGISTRFIELAGEINTAMPRRVVERAASALDRVKQRGLNGSRVLVIGVAYKKNIDDLRESPALRLMELLEQRGAQVDYHDPHVPAIGWSHEHPGLQPRRSVALNPAELQRYDLALIATDHDKVDYNDLARGIDLIVDTRNVCARKNVTPTTLVTA